MGVGKEAGEALAATYSRTPALAAVILATAALVLSLAFRFSPTGRADPFTGSEGREMEARMVDAINSAIATHGSLAHHTASESPQAIARLEAHYVGIKEDLREIKAILNDR